MSSGHHVSEYELGASGLPRAYVLPQQPWKNWLKNLEKSWFLQKKKILVWGDDPPEDPVISIVAGCLANHDRAHSLARQPSYFKVPQVGIDSIRSKLVFKIFDEYANILKGMYSTRFNGRPKNKDDHDQMDTAPLTDPHPPLITSLQVWQSNKIRRQKEKEKKGIG
jgi:hypothetical protein